MQNIRHLIQRIREQDCAPRLLPPICFQRQKSPMQSDPHRAFLMRRF